MNQLNKMLTAQSGYGALLRPQLGEESGLQPVQQVFLLWSQRVPLSSAKQAKEPPINQCSVVWGFGGLT